MAHPDLPQIYMVCVCTGVVRFEMEQYTVVEGQPLATLIRMIFGKTQNNFSMTLNPISIEDAENMFTVRTSSI